MARAAVIGEPLRICGYGLAGAVLCPAADQQEAMRCWQALTDDIAVVVLTPQAADWLGDALDSRPGLLSVVLPDPPAWAAP